MLGQDMVRQLHGRGDDVTGVDRDDVDITDPIATLSTFSGYDVVVNCAAWTAVDAAEENEPAAFAVNALGAASVARAVAADGGRLVHISTDYVFDGVATEPYGEGSAPSPRSAYGRTKLAGEWAVRAEAPDHLIVRTAWLYGAMGPCFPKTVVRIAAERGGIDVVDDQFGQPTWTSDLADLVFRLIDAGAPTGTYHGMSSGVTSWHGLARAAVAAAGLNPADVRPTSSSAFVRPAPRPAYSVLGHDALRDVGVAPIGAWDERWRAAAGAVLGG